MGFQLDTRAFESALKTRLTVIKKDSEEVLNRAGRNLAYRASQFTEPATASRIKHDLTRHGDENLLAALTSIRLKKKGIGRVPAPQFRKEMEKTLAARIGSARYLRAAWAEAVEKFGGKFRGKPMHGASAKVIKATAASLIAEIVAMVKQPTEGKAKSAERKMFPALQKAIDFVAADMAAHDAAKILKGWMK